MKRIAFLVAVAATAALAAPLFTPPAESTWAVTSAGKPVATVTLLTDGKSVRAEWKAATGAPSIFITTAGKTWMKQAGGDIELDSAPLSVEKQVLPALLLPSVAGKTDVKSAPLTYGTSSAKYTFDANGAASVEVKSGKSSWTLTRKTFGKPKSTQAALFAVQPKKTAATRMAAVAGGLLGPSDRSVSATAGGRGVEKGAKFADGGDYDALAELEARDEGWQAKLPKALEKFQKDGKVGESRGGDR